MKMHSPSWIRLALFGLSLQLFVGCGGGDTSSDAAPETTAEESAQAPSATSTVKIVDNGASTPAGESVAIFLDSLRRGNEAAVNGVLTAVARQELAKTTYVLQPLGAPEGKFEIGRVSYPLESNDVALVECSWQDPPSADYPEPETVEIVCETRQEPEGWRISGIVFSIPGTEEILELDFENAVALQATVDAATGQTPAPETAVAGSSTLPPPLPQFPSEQPAAPAGGNVQIALPPLPGGPVNR